MKIPTRTNLSFVVHVTQLEECVRTRVVISGFMKRDPPDTYNKTITKYSRIDLQPSRIIYSQMSVDLYISLV